METVLAVEIMLESHSSLVEKDNPSILEDDFSSRTEHLHINGTSVIRAVKQKQLSFSSNEINWPLCVPVHTDQKIWTRPNSSSVAISSSCEIRCLITLRVQNSITDNIIRKVINIRKKRVGRRMEAWVTQAFTGYFCETSHPEPFKSLYYWEKNKIRPNIWPEIP